MDNSPAKNHTTNQLLESALEFQLAQIESWWADLYSHNNITAVHETRKAIRRVETLLNIFKRLEHSGSDHSSTPLTRSNTRDPGFKTMHQLLKRLGRLRDIQVLVENLTHYRELSASDNSVDQEDLEHLLTTLTRKCDQQHKKLTIQLDKETTQNCVAATRHSNDGRKHNETLSLDKKQTADLLIMESTRQCMTFSSQEALFSTPKELHKLRLAFKELRYRMQFFEAQLDSKQKTLLLLLDIIQDQLGAYNDANVGLNLMRKFTSTDETNKFYQHLCQRREQQLNAFKQSWTRFQETSGTINSA